MKRITALVLTCVFMLSAVFAAQVSASVAAPPAPTDFKIVITKRETSSDTKDRVYISASWKMVAGADGYGLSHATKAWNDSEAESSGLLKTTVGGVDRRGFDINFLCDKSTSSADAVKSFNFSVGAYEHDGEEHVYSTKVYSPAITDNTAAANAKPTTSPAPAGATAASSERFYSKVNGMLVYSINKDAGDARILAQRAPNIDIRSVMLEKDGWVYYSSGIDVNCRIWKVRTDGTGNTAMTETSRFASYNHTPYFGVADGWIYYAQSASFGSSIFNLYRKKADGTGNPVLVTNSVDAFSVADDGYIYYATFNGGDGSLHKIKGDGTGDQVIARDRIVSRPVASGEWIYYIREHISDEGSDICRVRADGTGSAVVSSFQNFAYYELMKIGNGMIFYSGEGYGLYKVNMDGSGKTGTGVDAQFSSPTDIIFNGGAAYVLANIYSGSYATNFERANIYKITPGSTEWGFFAIATQIGSAAAGSSSVTPPTPPAVRTAAPAAPRVTAPSVAAPAASGNRTPCTKCGGDGWLDCEVCGGEGVDYEYFFSDGMYGPVTCRSCLGEGEIQCYICFGNGWTEK